MLAKCANPECSHVFRYLGTGKLYRHKHKNSGNVRRMEHFWLCADCAPKLTIAIERSGKPIVIPRAFIGPYREVMGRISWMPEIGPAPLTQSSTGSQETKNLRLH